MCFPEKFLEYIQERGGDVIHTENGEPGLFIPFNLGLAGSEEEDEVNYDFTIRNGKLFRMLFIQFLYSNFGWT